MKYKQIVVDNAFICFFAEEPSHLNYVSLYPNGAALAKVNICCNPSLKANTNKSGNWTQEFSLCMKRGNKSFVFVTLQ